MENREFRFQGLDAKTELRLALNLIFPALFIMVGTLIITNMLFPKIYFLFRLLFAAFLTLAVSMFILKEMIQRIKNKMWVVKINNGNMEITFQSSKYNFPLSTIKMIKNLGEPGFRYLTIKTNNQIVKFRVGNTGLTPFSTDEDIKTIDDLVAH